MTLQRQGDERPGRTTHAVYLSTDHEPCVPQLRFHDAAPLNVSIHITTPPWFCVWRSSGAERFERITIIGLQAVMRRQVLSAAKISHSRVKFARRVRKYRRFHSLFRKFRVGNVVLEIKRAIYAHHIQLPSLTFLVWGCQDSLLNHKYHPIAKAGTEGRSRAIYIPGHNTPPRNNAAIHEPVWESNSDFEPSFQKAIQPPLFFWSLDPPLVTVA